MTYSQALKLGKAQGKKTDDAVMYSYMDYDTMKFKYGVCTLSKWQSMPDFYNCEGHYDKDGYYED